MYETYETYETYDLPSPENTIREVRRLANENPDHIYLYTPRGCLYADSYSGKGCIIGQAWGNLGVPNDVLNHIDKNPDIGTVGEIYGSLGILGKNINWLMRVQGNQDRGFRWSEAVTEADGFTRQED